jgi:hypothetical protein
LILPTSINPVPFIHYIPTTTNLVVTKQQRQVAVAENRQQQKTDGGGKKMALGLMAVNGGKTEAIERRSLLL